MMSLAIGDPDNTVRLETLTALNMGSNRKFVPFLISSENLRKLNILVYDSNFEI